MTDPARPSPAPRIFYGWKMVGAASLMQFLSAAVLSQSFGAYVAVLRDAFGWSKTALAGAAAVQQQMEGFILGPLQGWIIDRFGARAMIRFGVVCFGTGLMLLSQVNSLPAFYGCFVVLALGTGLSGYLPLSIALIHWFEKKRARALSTMSLGLAVAGTMVPLVAWCLTTFGWRATAFCSGVLVLLVNFPLAGVIRNRPADIGEVPDGRDATPAETKTAAPAYAGPELTVRQALRTSAFWLISAGHALALVVVGAVNVHAITHMREQLGYSIAQAAFVMSLMTASQVAGIVLGGAIGDRVDKRRISAICMVAHTAGLLLLTYATAVPMLVGFAILHGGAWGLRGPFMGAMRADHFGRRSIGLIMGLSSIVVVLGQVGGPLLAGIFSDHLGNYRVGFTVLAGLSALGCASFLLIPDPKR